MPALFGALMDAGRDKLVVTTLAYVPDEAMQAALCMYSLRPTSANQQALWNSALNASS